MTIPTDQVVGLSNCGRSIFETDFTVCTSNVAVLAKQKPNPSTRFTGKMCMHVTRFYRRKATQG